jgi:protoporphyrinogen oxidase
MQKTAIIIGAGPAGLTAAYELLTRAGIKPIILEQSQAIGGISQTINYKGNRMDIGGHRFFSKSDRVMDWWMQMMPIEKTKEDAVTINYQNKQKTFATHHELEADVNQDTVLLIRERQSRIYYLKKFFKYPVSLSFDTIKKLGIFKIIKIGFSYIYARLFPIRKEQSLEDFFINRFGRELYHTFFKDYTEKVWGIACNQISADWGKQRIKELNISKALVHALKSIFGKKKNSIGQKNVETSLIEKFLYPKLGPGQMWETTAEKIKMLGGEIRLGETVSHITLKENKDLFKVDLRNDSTNIKSITTTDAQGNIKEYTGDYFFSTMAIKDLFIGMQKSLIPEEVYTIATNLQYRDFMIVGLLVKKLAVKDESFNNKKTFLVKDNWIYIQEKEVRLGRLQVFNNWSPYMVADNENTVWLGLEYFCNEGDVLWQKENADFIQFATKELESIGIINATDVLDATCVKMAKTYPAYFGAYNAFDQVKDYLNTIDNLFCIGRNGMHKYNNSDHSMLTAMTAVDNIIAGSTDKENIWHINTEQDYHEEK